MGILWSGFAGGVGETWVSPIWWEMFQRYPCSEPNQLGLHSMPFSASQTHEGLTYGNSSATSSWTQTGTQGWSSGKTGRRASSGSWSQRLWLSYGEKRKTTVAWPMKSSAERWGEELPVSENAKATQPARLRAGPVWPAAWHTQCPLLQVLLQKRNSGTCGRAQTGL